MTSEQHDATGAQIRRQRMAEIENFPKRSNCSNGDQAACSPSAGRRGQDLHAALNSKETFSSDDQERVPANLHALIETLCAQNGISKRAIVEASGMGGGGPEDSTKRLYEYTLPPNASETRKKSWQKNQSNTSVSRRQSRN